MRQVTLTIVTGLMLARDDLLHCLHKEQMELDRI